MVSSWRGPAITNAFATEIGTPAGHGSARRAAATASRVHSRVASAKRRPFCSSAWAESGLPVNRGKKMISLERQVRIVAGSLVLLGSIVGYFIEPAFIGLSAFVGAGLLFAGITDTCGMGMILARMPWNRVQAGKESS